MGRPKSQSSTLTRLKSGLWRVRWHQDERCADGSVQRRQLERRFGSALDARRFKTEVDHELRVRGYWQEELPPRHRSWGAKR